MRTLPPAHPCLGGVQGAFPKLAAHSSESSGREANRRQATGRSLDQRGPSGPCGLSLPSAQCPALTHAPHRAAPTQSHACRLCNHLPRGFQSPSGKAQAPAGLGELTFFARSDGLTAAHPLKVVSEHDPPALFSQTPPGGPPLSSAQTWATLVRRH